MCRKRIETILCVFKNEMLIFEKQIHDFLKKTWKIQKDVFEKKLWPTNLWGFTRRREHQSLTVENITF
jgi:hypothetical protein